MSLFSNQVVQFQYVDFAMIFATKITKIHKGPLLGDGHQPNSRGLCTHL